MFSFWEEGRSHDLIINEIRSCCLEEGCETTESMALFVVSNMLIIPKHKFYEPKDDLRLEIIKVTNLAVKDILSKTGIKMKLLKAQAYFSKDFGGQDFILREHKKLLDIYIEPLKKHVLRTNTSIGPSLSNKTVFRQLVLLIVLLSGMGDPSDPTVYAEAEAALGSVLGPDELNAFLELSKYKKEQEIEQLSKLLVGIRLFNKVRKLGGAGIDNLPKILQEASNLTQIILQDALKRINNKLLPLEEAVQTEFEWDTKFFDILTYIENRKFTDEELEFAKDLLALWQQISSYISTMLVYVEAHLEELHKVKMAMNKRLTYLLELTTCKVAVDSSIIYPQFRKLFKHWRSFQDLLVLISVYHKMLKNMMLFAKIHNLPKSILAELVKPFNDYEGEIINPSKVEPYEVVYPQSGADIFELEFGGFCPIYGLLGPGLVLRVNRKIGVVKYDDKFYGFRDIEAAYVFCKNPDVLIRQLVDFVRCNPEYIEIFEMRRMVHAYEFPYASDLPFHRKKLTVREKSVQCEVHVIQDGIDPKYRSNTWQLKKDACQLANILNMKTHSMQTDLSHYYQDVATQTYLPKSQGAQTMCDNYTNVPKLQNFLYGLRGKREDVQHTVILTRPVKEGLTYIK